ncbi:MAG: 23S rRNA pseudouridine(1911/1915/1917) synthase RluD [Gammaproteobacteria bacterium]|jgi:23S rRNA pseudouridine1911/1915/1917 synthase|nr:23S rRNA pseudouridine(1911/1915/1917) synthase RluD [Gammaproteobacteria bacterium]
MTSVSGDAEQALSAEVTAEQDGKRFDQVLAEMFPDYSRARLQGWIRDGRARLDGVQVLPRLRVKAGQQARVTPQHQPVIESRSQALPLAVLYEDADVIVINKPAGLVVHPGAGNPDGTLLNGLLHHAPELSQLPRAGILHRLDKDTSGLLLIARSLRAHTRLTRDLEQREIRREYRAVCNDRLTAGGCVNAPVGRHRVQRTRMAVTSAGRLAVTHYRVLQRFAAHTFIAVRLETGRTHQIRVHMLHEGHPLVGDPVYGGRLKIPKGAAPELAEQLRSFKRQALHASDLGFRHPDSGAEMQFHAPLPADLTALLQALNTGNAARDFDAMLWP